MLDLYEFCLNYGNRGGNAGVHYTYFLIDPRDDAVFYVGKGVGRRMHQHLTRAKGGSHRNALLQNHIAGILADGYMPEAEPVFTHCDEWPCLIVEAMAIAFYGRENLCNRTDVGSVLDPETRAKLSDSRRGVPRSEETRLKLSIARKGMKLTKEWRENISRSHTGKPMPPGFGEKMSTVLKGVPKSPEHVAKMIASLTGYKHTPEARENMGTSHRGEKGFWFGKKLSEEHKAKLSAYRRSHPRPSKLAKVLPKEWLENAYLTKQKSLRDIAKEVGVHYSTVHAFCLKYGIQMREKRRPKKSVTYSNNDLAVSL